MKVVLELQDQPANIRRITVRHDIVIGRGADCNLRLSSPQISRRHCFVRVTTEGATVTDLESSNGTYINGKRIPGGKRVFLKNGVVLSVGPIRFAVRITEDSAAVALKAATDTDPRKADVGSVHFTPDNSPVREADRDEETTNDFRSARDPAGRAAPTAYELDSESEIVDLGKQAAALAREGGGFSTGEDDIAEAVPVAEAVEDEVDDLDELEFLDEDDDVIEAVEIVEEADDGVIEVVEVIDEEDEVYEVVDVVEDVEIIDDVEVIDEVEVVDDVEVIDDVEVVDQPASSGSAAAERRRKRRKLR